MGVYPIRLGGVVSEGAGVECTDESELIGNDASAAHLGEEEESMVRVVELNKASDGSGPGDDVSVRHFVEQLEREGGRGGGLEVHVEEVVLEEEGGGEEGELEDVGVDGASKKEV